MNFRKYKSIVFDCDGVILNTNKIKTEGFRVSTKNYKNEYVELLVKYHLLNGGISRFRKFEYFLDEILPNDSNSNKNLLLEKLLVKYQSYTQKEIINAEITPELNNLRFLTKDTKWFIVSGGEQTQIRNIFKQRKLDHFFNGGIYGSPKDKDQILKREISKDNLKLPALFLGDSKYDHKVAELNKLDFIFVFNWTDFKEYNTYCKKNSLKQISMVKDLKNFF
tara:strand:+ start:1418 stop:2083 length:666 start_codon:yes stop_codon:yes gene_type:complete